jgi:hypothetical protein
MMVCKDEAMEALVNAQKIVDDEGLISDEEVLPMSVLDITGPELKSIEEHFTPDAYKNACRLG